VDAGKHEVAGLLRRILNADARIPQRERWSTFVSARERKRERERARKRKRKKERELGRE
jgi:hypothetical protein